MSRKLIIATSFIYGQFNRNTAIFQDILAVFKKKWPYFHKYGHLLIIFTLREASIRFIKEDPDHIIKITRLSGLDANRTIRSLSRHEFESYWQAIEKNEEWIMGREDFIDNWYITGVRLKHGIINEFCIIQNGQNIWLSKQEAVFLTNQHQLHAIVVHMKNGNCYLRPEYHAAPFSSLIV